MLYTCTVCKDTKTEETGLSEALGHTFTTEVVAPTCSAQGYTREYCTVCGYEKEHTNITEKDPNAHTYDTDHAVIIREPTCAVPGVAKVTCTGCGYTTYQTVTAEHNWDKGTETKPATCTEEGVLTFKCQVCQATKTEPIQPTGHTFGEEQVSEDNLIVYKECETCGYREIIANLGCEHKNTETKNAVVATCTENGYTGDLVCQDCGETIEPGETVFAAGHTEKVIPGKEATCTETGLTEGSHCSVCGAVIEAQETIPAKGHTPVEVPEVPATEESAGTTAGTKCSVCGEILSGCEIIPPLSHEHVWDDGVETKAPTCTEAGEMTYTCSCGETRVETIPAKGHSYKVSVSYNDDYSKIIYTYTCSACGDSYKEEFDL